VESIPTDDKRLLDFLTDSETSLLGREYFGLRLEEEFKKSWRYGWALTLLLVEMEGLERIRDAEGERAYRSAILDIAGEILSASRDTDLSTRLTQTRFAIALPGTGQQGAQAFVERVLRRILDGGFGRLTLHIGGSCSPLEDLSTCEELISRAESGVVMARAQGPNQYVCWTAPSPDA